MIPRHLKIPIIDFLARDHKHTVTFMSLDDETKVEWLGMNFNPWFSGGHPWILWKTLLFSILTIINGSIPPIYGWLYYYLFCHCGWMLENFLIFYDQNCYFMCGWVWTILAFMDHYIKFILCLCGLMWFYIYWWIKRDVINVNLEIIWFFFPSLDLWEYEMGFHYMGICFEITNSLFGCSIYYITNSLFGCWHSMNGTH